MISIKELKNKNESELQKLLAENREKIRELRFKDSNKQLKNVRQLRQLKKDVARLLTLINQKPS